MNNVYFPNAEIVCVYLFIILTQHAYIGNEEKSCFILQQIHWAETRDVIKRRSDAILVTSIFISMTLDGITSFSRIKNVRNT